MSRYYVFMIALLACLTAIQVHANPITFLEALTRDPEDQLLFRMVDLFAGDYEDDSADSDASDFIASPKRPRSIRPENCKLPMKRGMCRALIPRWRYDPTTKTCMEFKFGGCDGNLNNFRSYNECMQNCEGV